jgi:vacuolar-type H+-ATPase subunit E/Vma4
MGVAEILRAIEQEADEEVARIGAEARRQADAILAEARREADHTGAAVVAAAVDRLDAERRRLRQDALAAAARLSRTTREVIYQRALGKAGARLAAVRDRPDYQSLLGDLLREAVSALPDAKVVRVDPRDAHAVAALAAEAGVGAMRVDAERDTRGGVEVATEDGRAVRNTLEERLARAEPYLRAVVARTVPGMGPWEAV